MPPRGQSPIAAEYQLDVQPFRDWVDRRLKQLEDREEPNERRRRDGAIVQLRAELGWRDDAGSRRLHRWRREQTVVDRRDVEQALDHAGVQWWEVYPDPHADEALPDERFCFHCRAFVTPYFRNGAPASPWDLGRCPWDDREIIDVDLSKLPPRPSGVVALPSPAEPSLIVRHRPRQRMPPRPFYLDVRLDVRRAMLEALVDGHGIEAAAQIGVERRVFTSTGGAAAALRTLLEREGWWSRPGRGARARERELATARARVRAALAEGTWDRVVEQQVLPSQRRAFDEALLREAAWLYFYDELGFGTIAKRLLSRSRSKTWANLKSALLDEWNARGWPRRTSRVATGYTKPTRRQRCKAHTLAGKPCERYAQKGKDECFDHDPERAEEARARNVAASRKAYEDAVPIEPWRLWLQRRVKTDMGSVAAIHRKVGDAVSYDTLADWTKLRPRGGRSATVVRRSTIDRVLAAWGEGVTFEDVYMPVANEDLVVEDLVTKRRQPAPEAKAA